MYTDGQTHGPDAVCPTCGMTDAKLASVITRVARTAMITWRILLVVPPIAGLTMLWWALTGQGSFLHFTVGAYLALKVPYDTFTRQTESLVSMINQTVNKEVCLPCQHAQNEADAMAATLTDTTMSMEERVAYLRVVESGRGGD